MGIVSIAILDYRFQIAVLMFLKRLRGFLLRFLLKRPVAITTGLVMTLPAVWLLVQDLPWESPITDGLGLVVGATGVAFLLAGIGGRRPDWIE
jgi:hypothetical protein